MIILQKTPGSYRILPARLNYMNPLTKAPIFGAKIALLYSPVHQLERDKTESDG